MNSAKKMPKKITFYGKKSIYWKKIGKFAGETYYNKDLLINSYGK